MLVIVSGGSGSGKSAFAENTAMKLCPGRKIYLATMEAIDGEMEVRIAKHREMRKDKQFETIEKGRDIGELLFPRENCVLLECMSNLLANEMYAPERRTSSDAEVVPYIMDGIRKLYAQTEHLIIVTNEIFAEKIPDGMDAYVRCLGELNRRLADAADAVVEVVFGIPVYHKGEL